jgi:aldose 1-epimerase
LIEDFGTTAAGETVKRITISSGVLTAKILTWGAVLQDLRHEAQEAPLVLGFDEFDHYPAHSPFFGATAGRCANRIGHGRFSIDDTAYQVDVAANGHHLHGRNASFGERNWILEGAGEDFVILSLISRHGEAGYPGTVSARATFRLRGDVLSVTYESSTDAPTVVNLCHHSYFTLTGDEETILDHVISLPTTSHTQLDDDLIPTGQIADARGTDLDYTDGKPVRERMATILDTNFCLSHEPFDELVRGCIVTAPDAALSLEVWTDQPGIQIYCGHKINCPVPGLDGRPLKAWGGIAIEPQIWPDAVNHVNFPTSILRPGETRIQRSEFRFPKA